MSKQKVYYIVVYSHTGAPVIESGRLPIFWHRKVAIDYFKAWNNVRVGRVALKVCPRHLRSGPPEDPRPDAQGEGEDHTGYL
jgi:hypothetical protein